MLKRILYYSVSTACIFSSAYFMPALFLLAFNYGKGIQNNEDGIIFIPFGFLLIVSTMLIDILLVRKALKMNSRFQKWLVVAVLIVICIVSVTLTFSTWETFFECFGHYRGLNLGLQR